MIILIKGVKEITLLGQNVNTYLDNKVDQDEDLSDVHTNSKGFNELYKLRHLKGLRFAELLDKCANIAPDVRFRFTSPHPKDFPDSLLHVIKDNDNICKS